MNLKQPSYPLASSTWDGKETEAMHEVIRSGQFTMGERVRGFEKKFAAMTGSKYAVMLNSGSSANLVLVNALKFHSKFRLNPGDEIIVPAVSWSTTFYPVTQSEFILRFVDVDLNTLNIDVTLIEKAITEKTKAISSYLISKNIEYLSINRSFLELISLLWRIDSN
jgi:CDP-6-deoxy-D-xylo-4-hexulose-3-dehydrase